MYKTMDNHIRSLCGKKFVIPPIEDWKIVSSAKLEVTDTVFYSFLREVYNISTEEVLEFLEMFTSIDKLPCTYHVTGFSTKLWRGNL